MVLLRRLGRWLDPRSRAVAVVVAIWIVVAVVSAGPTPSEEAWLGLPSFGSVLLWIGAVAIVVGLVLFLAILVLARGEKTELPERRPTWPMWILLLVLVLVLGLVEPIERPPAEGEQQPAVEATGDLGDAGAQPNLARDDLLVVFVLAGSAVLVAWWARRRLAPVATDDSLEPDRHVLDRALERTEVVIRHGGDPRAAVLAAYATLEAELGAAGLERNPTETAGEYLTRVLEADAVEARSTRELGALFELARFSHHEITAKHRDDAAALLARARQPLAAGR